MCLWARNALRYSDLEPVARRRPLLDGRRPVPPEDDAAFDGFREALGYRSAEDTGADAYERFLA